ncbi:MAG: DUF3623 domain-containing protein [Chloroflexi bacterium]|nr:DUF3623 domain-containing protein [Chloroflexota bacterium]
MTWTDVLPVVFAIFLWWFTTGLFMSVYGRPPAVLRRAFAIGTGLLIAALLGLWVTRGSDSPLAVTIAVTCGVLVWGWQVAAYYLGFITGPPLIDSPQRPNWKRSLIERFRLALTASLYHELMALGTALLLIVVTWNQPNRWGLWMYLALWLMHLSAKLNVFFGVRNFHIEVLPRELHHLAAYLTPRSSNAFFPFSVAIIGALTWMLIAQAINGGGGTGPTVGAVMVATMTALGFLEHWMLVLPLPATLWGWSIRPLPEPVEEGD